MAEDERALSWEAMPAPSSSRPDTAPLLAELAQRVARHAPVDGVHETGVAGACAIRRSRPQEVCVPTLYAPAVFLIAQGAKTVSLGAEDFAYDARRLLVLSCDLHVKAQVTQASPARPYLCLRLQIDPAEVAALLLRMPPAQAPREATARAAWLSAASGPLLDAAVRLLRAADDPREATLLGPLAMQEILVRLLASEHGARLAQAARPDAAAHRIAQAIDWLKANAAEPMRIDALAARVHMSASSLHHHFRAVTGLSPLQYQKALRLQEARRLLLGGRLEVSRVAHRVGYESASQFSRDYSRHFGDAPSRELQRVRTATDPTV